MPTIASATRTLLAYTRERVRGTKPAGIATAVTNIAAAVGGTGEGVFTRAAGSWITDGFAPGQYVFIAGFAAAGNNGSWRVKAVTTTDLTVDDPGDVIIVEAAEAGQTAKIQLQTMRVLTKTINLEKDRLESEEIDTVTRQKLDVRHGFNRVVGNPNWQFSRKDFDEIMEAATGGAWAKISTSGVNLATTSPSTITRASGDFLAEGYRPGDLVLTAGFTNGANNGLFRAATVAALTITIVETTLVTEASAAGRTVILKGARLDISTTLHSLFVERQFLDILQFERNTGVAINELSWNVSPNAIVGGALALLGLAAEAVGGASESTLSPKAISGSSPYSAFDGAMYEGGLLIAVVTALEFSLNNNRTTEPVVGSKFSPDIFEGEAMVAGQLTAFFTDAVLYNKFINETETNIWLKLGDPNGTDFANVVLPRVKYTGARKEPAQRGPVTQVMPFDALLHLTTLTSLSIQMSDR